MATLLVAIHESDPKQDILDLVSDSVSRLKILGARVLVSVYVRPQSIKLGSSKLLLPDKVRDEDRYQGKVGLVLAMEPLAFHEYASHRFGDVIPKVGDWVQFRVPESFPFELLTSDGRSEKSRARYIEDVDIWAILDNPDLVY